MKKDAQMPKYGMRKLSIGFVSCLLGLTLVAGLVPSQAYASSKTELAKMTEVKEDKESFDHRVKEAKEALKKYMDTLDPAVLDNPAIHYENDQVKGQVKAAIQRAKDLLADDKIDQAKLEEMEKIPFKNVDGKKSGLFRDFTHKALVDFEVLGDRDQENPHNKKKYTTLKDNKIWIKTNLKEAKKMGESDKVFLKLNYVKDQDYKDQKIDALSSSTPKYKKQELPLGDYSVKAVDQGYEITIHKLPEACKFIKPIVMVKLADKTYFENGDLVFASLEKSDQKAEKAKYEKYIYGYEDQSFRPEGKISRAEAASMIAHLAGLDLTDQSKANFKDTPSAWYNAAIHAMVKKDLMLADKDGNFRPNDPITRGEFARALAGIDKKSDKKAPFADIKGHEFEEAINQAYGNGHIVGYPDGSFKPNGQIQRAEAVTILNHYDGRIKDQKDLLKEAKDLKTFKDVKEGYWAYVQVVLAANSFK